jgi:hypothetical protein
MLRPKCYQPKVADADNALASRQYPGFVLTKLSMS